MAMRVSFILCLCIVFTLTLEQTEASPRVPVGPKAPVGAKRAAGFPNLTQLHYIDYWIILFKVLIMTITILTPFINKSKLKLIMNKNKYVNHHKDKDIM